MAPSSMRGAAPRCAMPPGALLAMLLALAGCHTLRTTLLPWASSDLQRPAPISRWDEAMPLGNGLTGGLLWGGPKTLKLSLDRGDLWDLRTPRAFQSLDWNYQTMRRLHAAADQARMVGMFDTPYEKTPYPTKIPAGRLELDLFGGREPQDFFLDLHRAEARVRFEGASIGVFFSATTPVAMMRLHGISARPRLVRPAALDQLGYPAATFGAEAKMSWFVQKGSLGLVWAVVVGSRARSDGLQIALAITSTNDGEDPLQLGKERVQRALGTGYRTLLLAHRVWWNHFWSVSRVTLPDAEIQAQYDLVKYLYGAGSRPGAPPMPLQGVWTADGGKLPPWKGDYHNDLNTEMTYLAYHTAGLLEAGNAFLEWNWQLLPAFERFARRFFGVTGAVVPGVTALDGQPLGGWAQYAMSPTNGAWVAHSFYLHWRYTMDRAFLEERAYPFCAEIGEGLLGVLEQDESGVLKLPLSSSPEIHDNSMRAWLTPDSNYDQALMRWLFGALSEMARARKDEAAARRWDAVLARLDPLDLAADGSLTFGPGEPFAESHRHFSNAMAIHPLGLIERDASPSARRIVDATLDRILAQGTKLWVGYSFSWMACLLARAGRADAALSHLHTFVSAFLLANGFHANGDQSGKGYSRLTYRPFTLEGNFLAMQAVHEMLLQSQGGLLRIFPAVSKSWRRVSYQKLRAEGGYRVSAVRERGRTTRINVVATRKGMLRLRDPFGGATVLWNTEVRPARNGIFEIYLEKGDELWGVVLLR